MFVCSMLKIWLLALLLTPSESAQILGLFGHPGKSHFDFFRPMFLALAQNGHNISMYSYFPNKMPVTNYTDYVFDGMPVLTDIVDLKPLESEPQWFGLPFKVSTFFMLHDWGLRSCEVALHSPLIAQLLSSGMRYDVIILEHFANDCMQAVAHLLRAPVIALSSCAIMPWHYKRMGTPFLEAVTPMNFLPYTDEMGFVERVNNFLHFHIVALLHNLISQPATDALIAKRFGAGLPPINEIVTNTSLMLINQHYALTGARPYAPNVVEVGGLQITPQKPLPENLDGLLKQSKQGVIYISWGSMVNPATLPATKRQQLFECIRHFGAYSFVMRWSNDSMPSDKPSNLHFYDWLPQRDLLCHPQVKAFMTHGGLLGSSEAVHCGVPMLVTPFYGDQFLNAGAIVQRRFGVTVNFANFDSRNLIQALHTILSAEFAAHVKHSTAAFRQRPQPPLELALWWIEHVIDSGGAPLAQSVARHINWLIYNSLDVYLFLLCVIFLILWALRLLIKLVQSLATRRVSTTEADTKAKKQ
ncbi:UDP-glucuronosyltransferase 1-3 [Scaptodrosophila lebanonensis]|uniref:UDP-glucuronosyltransferase n=1 Tax=Drosophila lebanonensis TaxID=7225 RepID=A0A6J2U736_DROLE|nr:UDP-glucuronosyltransferase 1-3 [Scaptodrosophila lebanonensis]